MAKTGFGGPKDRSHLTAPDCPKCGHKLERRDRRKIRIGGVTYGESGMFWCCTNVKHIKEKGEYYEPQCDYEERIGK